MKIDFKKTVDSYQAKLNVFNIIKVPKMQYLMINGQGGPNTSQEYKDAITLLYPMAYTLKFTSKIDLDKDYVVPPFEGLWWADDMNIFMNSDNKSQWKWTAMLMVPDWITRDMFEAAKKKIAIKSSFANLEKLRLGILQENDCVQTLFVGPYSKEGSIISKMHQEFMPNNNLKSVGKHHEIYLSDPRKVAPDKLRTIIRQPVRYIK